MFSTAQLGGPSLVNLKRPVKAEETTIFSASTAKLIVKKLTVNRATGEKCFQNIVYHLTIKLYIIIRDSQQSTIAAWRFTARYVTNPSVL